MQRRRNSSVLPRLPAKESIMDNNFLFAFRSSSHESHFLSLPQSVRPGKILSVCHQSCGLEGASIRSSLVFSSVRLSVIPFDHDPDRRDGRLFQVLSVCPSVRPSLPPSAVDWYVRPPFLLSVRRPFNYSCALLSMHFGRKRGCFSLCLCCDML